MQRPRLVFYFGMSAPSSHVTFTGSHGVELAARLDLPAGPVQAFALFAHCFTCSKDLFVANRIVAGLAAQGIGVLRFDFTGLGQSDGEFTETTFSSNLEDIRLAARWLEENYSAPQLLVGHSLGGAAVLALGGELESVRAVATIGAPSSASHISKLFVDGITEIHANGSADIKIGGRYITIGDDLIHDLETHDVTDRVAKLRAALLVIHSPIDQVVSVDHAANIFLAARHPKSFLGVDGADHLLSKKEDATFVADEIATWSRRYLVDENPAMPLPRATAPVVVAETGQGTFLNSVVSGDHRLLADEPIDAGGFDAGPGPYDFLAMGLGACTSMTLRLYAGRKNMNLERVTVEVFHEKVKEDDNESGRPVNVDVFTRRLKIEGDLDEAQRADLLRIADRCPVHRTLTSSSRIETVALN